MRHRSVAWLLAALLLIGAAMPWAAAAEPGRFVVSDASGEAGDIVVVMVSVENNPGIIAAALQVHYNSDQLKLVDVKNEKLIGGTATFSQSYDADPYYASWNDALASADNSKNGVLMTLTFQIMEDCPSGTSDISLTYREGDVFNKNYDDQLFVTVDGTVTVSSGSAFSGNQSSGSQNSGNQTAGTPIIGNQTAGTQKQPAGEITLYESYRDLKADGWYREYVESMLNKGYMKGMDATHFGPDGTMTRSQLVTILYRSAGSPAVSGGTAFRDVKAGSWYADAVAWSSAMGIVNGVGGNNFNPSGAITREQLATILYRYSGTTPDRVNHLAGFADTAAISSYAKETMNWAVGLGILNGTGGNKLSPGATATRAQTAAMLIRYWNATAAIPVPDTSVVS